MKISNEHAKFLLMGITIFLGAMNLYFLNMILADIYFIVAIGFMIAEKRGKVDKNTKIASRFWILVLPFLGVFNGPSKLGWFLAFLFTSWLASKNAFKEKNDEKKGENPNH